jgi:hypothetical protein
MLSSPRSPQWSSSLGALSAAAQRVALPPGWVLQAVRRCARHSVGLCSGGERSVGLDVRARRVGQSSGSSSETRRGNTLSATAADPATAGKRSVAVARRGFAPQPECAPAADELQTGQPLFPVDDEVDGRVRAEYDREPGEGGLGRLPYGPRLV